MQASGYPETVWRPILIRFEDERIDLIARKSKITGDPYDDFGNDLTKVLKEYRKEHGNSLPEVVNSSECGGIDDEPVHFSTDPKGGAISLIPKFFYRLCQVRKVDPNNPRVCDRWHDVLADVEPISGGYMYFVKWPDGSIKQGDLEASKLNGSVVLRK